MGTRLAILPNWLGDLVMAQPALERWRAGHQLIVVAAPSLADLVEDAAIADQVIRYDRRDVDRGLSGLWRCARRLRRCGADAALVLGPSLRAAAFAAATGVPRRIGMGGEGRDAFLTDPVRPGADDRSVHLVDRWVGLVDPTASASTPHWVVGEAGRTGAQRLRGRRPDWSKQFVVFGAGASFGPAKQWHTKGFREVARAVSRRWKLQPVFVGSPAAAERELAASLAEATGGISLAGETDLPTLAGLLADASLFVGNDSGPMHLAAALGTPTVGIFGSTSPAWTAPRGLRAIVAGLAAVDCSPCFKPECPFDRECLRELASETVLERVDFLLGPDHDSVAAEEAGT